MVDLSELHATVRRVIASRVSDRTTIEDLTQETFVRVVAVEHRLANDALLAYAIVTARNLTVSHHRSRAVHDRNTHRLVDYAGFDGPEEISLQRDETDALTVALATLEPDDRILLLRHEVDGTPIRELVDELGVSSGGVTMRLARARATLRLEFVLAFRHVELPTTRCRSILLALSAGDRRRQHALDAPAHLLSCATCADLVGPVTERRRAIAVWLIGPFAALVRFLRTRSSAQLAAAVGIAALTIGVTAVAFATVNPNPDTARGEPPNTDASLRGAQPDASIGTSATDLVETDLPATDATTSQSSPAATTPADNATGSVSECPNNLLDDPAATASEGCVLPVVTVTVTDVIADEAFVATTENGTTVWVMLIGSGESPITVVTDMTLTLHQARVTTVADDPAFGSPPERYDIAVTVNDADIDT